MFSPNLIYCCLRECIFYCTQLALWLWPQRQWGQRVRVFLWGGGRADWSLWPSSIWMWIPTQVLLTTFNPPADPPSHSLLHSCLPHPRSDMSWARTAKWACRYHLHTLPSPAICNLPANLTSQEAGSWNLYLLASAPHCFSLWFPPLSITAYPSWGDGGRGCSRFEKLQPLSLGSELPVITSIYSSVILNYGCTLGSSEK